ncbi:fimbrial protein [Cronobacter dublinensis]|uniref:fimbrial protein n=1 Tax=Cronobacter dublinensis TaxID=413497 RepID=UPI000CFE2B67|nr:fimbrial protein [Cronobacter dublinensis]
MKNITLKLAFGAAIISGAAQATATEDTGHDMVIYGRLESAKSGCTVLMSKYVLNLHHDERTLPPEGSALINNSRADEHVYVQLGGDNCDADEGYKNIGLKFLGATTGESNHVLANTDTSSQGAQGVGVQLTDMFNKIIYPNETIARFPGADPDGNPVSISASYPLYFTLVHLKGQDATVGNIQTNLTVQIERL